MKRENAKWQIHKAESTNASKGADWAVVAEKSRNGDGAKGLGYLNC